MNHLISRIFSWLRPADHTPAEIQRAKQLIASLDAGGIPLDPSIIVRIAEDLGLEVSRKARMEDTIERIRMAINRY
ncbi:MAG: hypothetical protein PHP57_08045 [Sideroxydans sp.]|nr:hypothetical protein [Sideroxydans sp.]